MDTQVLKIELDRLKNTEFLSLMLHVKAYIEHAGAPVLGIVPLFADFLDHLSRAQKALEAEGSDPVVKILDRLDILRDNAYRVLYYFVKAFTFSDEEPLKEAADEIMRIMKDDDNPLEATPDRESVLLDNIVSKLCAEPFSAYVSTLQAGALLDKVAAHNEAYKVKRKERIEGKAEKGSISIRGIRKTMEPLYRKMISVVNTFAPHNTGSEVFRNFIKVMNVEISKWNTVLTQRKTKNTKTGDK